MKLVKAHITKYKSINDSTPVEIDKNVTVLVGVNEAGKSAFLESLYKAESVLDDDKYNEVFDYPRKDWSAYKRRADKEESSVVAELTYNIEDDEAGAIEDELGKDVLSGRSYKLTHHIDNTSTVVVPVKEASFTKKLLADADISDGVRSKVASASTINGILKTLSSETLTGDDKEFFDELEKKYKVSNDTWEDTRLANYVYRNYLTGHVPKFLYFSDYNILPGKINIAQLETAQANGTTDAKLKTALGLLEMANISIEELKDPDSYEEIRAQLEAVSLNISQKVFSYWTQNSQLKVVFDVKADPKEEAPYNSGVNLYIRVENIDHGVTVPFDQRSKGFVWFFSFIVWFNSVKDRIGTDKDLILLLDEPGLSLHGLAQADFLHYIADLSKEYQIIYTTHSPFMIDSENLQQVRTVEDVVGKGTIVASNLLSTDRRTLFPLQAGLGYSLAQNLFIGAKNALVEGPADLIYWKYFSGLLEAEGREHLDDGIVIVPTGGLDKIATFVSLLSGNELKMAVVHDYEGAADQRLESLVKARIIKDKQITNYAQFRDPANLVPSDVEDMLDEQVYLDLFNATFSKELGGKSVAPKDLPKGDRVVVKIEKWLAAQKISLRPSGGFNHYLVASYLATNPLAKKSVSSAMLERFESMFKAVNALLK